MRNFLSKLFKKEEKIEYITGEDKLLEKVTLADFQQYPVWLFSKNNKEDADICWLVPVLNSTHVSKDLELAYILMRMEGTGYPVMGMLDLQRMFLDDLWYCSPENDEWRELRYFDSPSPIRLIALPTIMNKVDMEFITDDKKEIARRSGKK